MVASKSDSNSSCSVTRGEISSNGSIECSPEDPAFIASYAIENLGLTLNCFHEAPKQKKKPKCPPKSDKNKKDIRSYFAATPRQVKKKPETKKPKSPNVITID